MLTGWLCQLTEDSVEYLNFLPGEQFSFVPSTSAKCFEKSPLKACCSTRCAGSCKELPSLSTGALFQEKKMVDLETSWRLQGLLSLKVVGQWSASTTPKETRRASR
ncbi:hypothetical protein AV530_003746 [Patagioenas fasciata monilis]|uniref:Uncharacterized protein n=1 Tax=Patagioenas fasciata monilis TaxID=372326 RepID=A0A1V4KYT0_PATFA|nr:hypothetical protein AV530_003746 [Patagioenas fasciata monilis]